MLDSHTLLSAAHSAPTQPGAQTGPGWLGASNTGNMGEAPHHSPSTGLLECVICAPNSPACCGCFLLLYCFRALGSEHSIRPQSAAPSADCLFPEASPMRTGWKGASSTIHQNCDGQPLLTAFIELGPTTYTGKRRRAGSLFLCQLSLGQTARL